MTSSSNLRRYIVPSLFLVAVVASYAIGYLSNSAPELTPEQTKAALALAAPANANGAAQPGALANRIGGQFTDAGTGIGTVGQVTDGQPLEEWLKKLMAQEDEVYRLKNFMRLYDALNNSEDIKTAIKALRELNGGQGGRGGARMESSMLLQKFAMIDPNAAIAFATEMRGGERMMATGTVLRTWAKNAPDAALAWAKANGTPVRSEEGGEPREGREGPGGPGGPGGAGWAERMGNMSVASVITQIAKNDIDKALSEASSTKDRAVARTADSLARELIEQRGAESARKAAAALPEGDFKNSLIQELAGKMASQDPKGTATWASGLAAGETKSRALREAVQQWTRKDAAAAGAFVSSLPVGADSDGARSQFAVSVAAKDQPTALATIKGISDAERQKRTVGEIAVSIARRDPAAGQQFVAQTPIDDQAKASITRMLTPRQRGQGGQGRQGGPGGGGGGGQGRGGQAGGRGVR